MELFAENLPGLPDNIRRSKSGGYWVGAAIVRHPNRPQLYDWTAGMPFVRRVVAKVSFQIYFVHSNGQQYGKQVRDYTVEWMLMASVSGRNGWVANLFLTEIETITPIVTSCYCFFDLGSCE